MSQENVEIVGRGTKPSTGETARPSVKDSNPSRVSMSPACRGSESVYRGIERLEFRRRCWKAGSCKPSSTSSLTRGT